MKFKLTKTGALKLLPAMIAVLFVFIALIGFVPKLVKNAQYEKIARTGVATIARDVEYHPGHVLDNVQYFYLTFTYYDSNGEKRTGQTPATYTENEAANIVLSGKLKVAFNAKGAVNADFNRKEADKFPKTMAFVFVGIGVFLACVSVFTSVTKKSVASVDKHGVQTVGTVKGILGGTNMGEKEYFLVRVTFENQRGEEVVGNTEFEYEKDVYKTYRKGDKVSIKYYGTSVKILGPAEEEAEGEAEAV